VDLQGHRVRLKHKGLRPGSCKLACYVVDVEVTFSASPFASSKDGGNASHVTAIAPTVVSAVEDIALDGSGDDWVALPPAVQRRQMVLEVVAATHTGRSRNISACQSCYFCDARVTFNEVSGTLRVSANGKPLLGAYVKVFMGGAGSPKFYKDGYTDILGTFSYATINAKQSLLTSESRLAVLVVTQESGALVREVLAPPKVQPIASNQQSDLPAAVPYEIQEAAFIRPSGSDSSCDECSGSCFACEEEEEE